MLKYKINNLLLLPTESNAISITRNIALFYFLNYN